MSKVVDSQESQLGPDALLEAARKAVDRIKFRLKSQGPDYLIATQPFFATFEWPKSLLVTGWPAKVKATVTPAGGGGSRIDFLVTNFGFGPIQTNHCKKQLQRFIGALDEMMHEAGQAQPGGAAVE